jgi:hypothetical protein
MSGSIKDAISEYADLQTQQALISKRLKVLKPAIVNEMRTANVSKYRIESSNTEDPAVLTLSESLQRVPIGYKYLPDMCRQFYTLLFPDADSKEVMYLAEAQSSWMWENRPTKKISQLQVVNSRTKRQRKPKHQCAKGDDVENNVMTDAQDLQSLDLIKRMKISMSNTA